MDQTDHKECFFCAVIGDKTAPTFIVELPHTVALVNFDQTNYPGRSLVILKEHHTDYLELPKDLRHAFDDEVVHVAKGIQNVFGKVRMNFANLGNEVSHQHCHIIPRAKGGPNEGRPPWPIDGFEKLSDDEYRLIAERIRSALPDVAP